MKISYLISTAKPRNHAEYMINAVRQFAPHDHEIVVCSPDRTWEQFPGITFAFDFLHKGGAPGYNLAYQQATGDLIVITPDDHVLPDNFLSILDELDCPAVKRQKVRLGTLSWGFGGPGFPAWDKTKKEYLPNSVWPMETLYGHRTVPNAKPYSMACFPVMFKEDIDKYLDGRIFNDCFHQAFSDNFLSRYVYKINQCEIWWPENLCVRGIPEFCNTPNSSSYKNAEWVERDRNTYIQLVSLLHKGIRYNHIVPHE